jgi:hypothetical protein
VEGIRHKDQDTSLEDSEISLERIKNMKGPLYIDFINKIVATLINEVNFPSSEDCSRMFYLKQQCQNYLLISRSLPMLKITLNSVINLFKVP